MSIRTIKNFINGEFTAGESGKTYDVRTPLDNSVIAEVHEAGQAEVDAAVRAAKDAMTGPWGSMTADQRSVLLNKVADRIDQRFEEFLEAECLDTSKPRSLASHIDIPRGAANFRMFSENTEPGSEKANKFSSH